MTAMARLLTLVLIFGLQSNTVTAYIPALKLPRQECIPSKIKGRRYAPTVLCDWRTNASTTTTITSRERNVVLYNSDPNQETESSFSVITSGGAGIVGIVAQPVVWISLYYVATTGAGLPAGPYGLIGALEGLSYLAMLGLVASFVYSNTKSDTGSGSRSGLILAAQKLSIVSLFAGLLTLASLVGKQGCIPNAKPILDYSAYLPVCDAQTTPGLFGQ